MSDKLKVSHEIHMAMTMKSQAERQLEEKASTLLAWMNNPVITDAQQEYVSERYFNVMDELHTLRDGAVA